MAPCIKVGKYLIKKKIGEGAFAEVRLAVHENTGEEFAVKVFDRSSFPRADFERDIKKEIKIMQYLRHPNIVAIEAVLITARKMYIVMELVRGGELYHEIVRKQRVDELTSRAYFQQLVDGMVYCHRRGVVHRDLKPENILIEGDGTVKITDFGMSWMKERVNAEENAKELLRTQCGTPKYMPPEIIVRPTNGYDGEKLDAWECGMVLYALMAGYLPFSGATDNAVFRSILKGKLRFPNHFSAGAVDILSKLLEKDPEKRSSLSEIRNHFWFLVDYHGDAAKERNIARKLSSHMSERALGSDGSTDRGSGRARKSDDENSSSSGQRKVSMKNRAQFRVNNDSSFKDNKENHLRARKSQSSQKIPSLSLKEKLQNGSLVLSSNNTNVQVEPKPKTNMKIPIPVLTADFGNEPDEELQEIHYPSTPRRPALPVRIPDRKVSNKYKIQDKLPQLSLKIPSGIPSDVGEDEDTPLSFRDRLKSPFGAMLRSLRSGANVDDSEEKDKHHTSWFADSSPVSATSGPLHSPKANPASKVVQQTRPAAWKSPKSSEANGGLVALASEDSLALEETPATPSSRARRRFAALLQKKA